MPKFPASHDATALPPAQPPLAAPPELNPHTWERVSRRLLAKMLGEFAYEEIIEPVRTTGSDPDPDSDPDSGSGSGSGSGAGPGSGADRGSRSGSVPDADCGSDSGPGSGSGSGSGAGPGAAAVAERAPGRYAIELDDGSRLAFHARRGCYGSWRVAADSITHDGRPFTDPLRFLVLARRLLALDGATLGHLVRELTTTLAADTRLDHTVPTAARLADLDYAELEGHQTGHPWIVFNKGRVGFSATDADRWAPEARRPARLPWIAVSTELAVYRGATGLATPEDLYAGELDPDVRAAFDAELRARGLDPAGYLFLPVHPWQWDEVLLPLFAPAIAQNAIVPLPADNDLRLPQQSIRTFLNTSRPERHTVKLPLSVLNTLVWRGLPTERTLAAPAVTSWVHAVRDADPFLRDECGVILLGEVASVTVEHPLYDQLPEVPYQYKELLGAIWREPLRLPAGERARTLASLLHTDAEGRAFTAELVARSGLAPEVWLKHLFAALLPPLLRFLYRYGTVFSPHGENAIVVFDEQDVPVRLAIKDFVDDVNVSARTLPEHSTMSEEVREILLTEEPSFLTQFIHSGLFVGVFRYLAPLCEEQLGVSEDDFWSLVRAEIVRHHTRFPELKERYELFDLLTPRIDRLCLNRNRLHLDGYRDRPERPHAAVHGTVPNPLA
ncbi:IucA/IucC family siderophore biosynthesis protein [Streptomyces sp. LP05-1]|uniref:IucA/IucC family siderophore biosynthesis protein n=1 Tax=Streptomyces pyxinae TaxID=2970734 RepID=A0ABT2CJP2_9ACTN|nr:IucA/IucC family protein [Streptomyces sp. LP05-1]MCS0637633.1 IucA/IucC family siderophore biosynthesis protein [Streptomyces sp. LP05-1]